MAKNAHQSKGAPKRPKSAASMRAAWRALSEIQPNPQNVRLHSDEQVKLLAASIREFGQVWPILVDEGGMIVAHHGVFEALKREGFDEAKVVYVEGLSPDQIRAFVVADNRLAEISQWDEAGLRAELEALVGLGLDMDAVGYEADDLAKLFAIQQQEAQGGNMGSLARDFGVPPFTVLSARAGIWQERKDAWIALGIRSEEGRGENLLKFSASARPPDSKERIGAKTRKGAAAPALGGEV